MCSSVLKTYSCMSLFYRTFPHLSVSPAQIVFFKNTLSSAFKTFLQSQGLTREKGRQEHNGTLLCLQPLKPSITVVAATVTKELNKVK